jgi:hypothetical protein
MLMAALPLDHIEVVVQQLNPEHYPLLPHSSSKSERISFHPCIQEADFECVVGDRVSLANKLIQALARYDASSI